MLKGLVYLFTNIVLQKTDFESVTEPTWGKCATKEILVPQSIAFVKGKARTQTLTALLLILMDDDIDVAKVSGPTLKTRVSTLW